MNIGGKDETNSQVHNPNVDRSPPYQSIAKLAETTQKYLSQVGLDLRAVNGSSDSQNALQFQVEAEPKNNQPTNEIPLESNERDFQAESAQHQSAYIANHDQADRASVPAAPALNQAQPKVDSDNFKSAFSGENYTQVGDAKIIQAQHCNGGMGLPTISSSAEALMINENAPATSQAKPQVGPNNEPAPPDAQMEEARRTNENIPSSQFELEQIEKGEHFMTQIGNDDAAASIPEEPEKIQELPNQEITSEVIQSEQNENRVEKSPESDGRQSADAKQAGRAIRQCARYTPNYSHTHKGITSANFAKNVTSFESEAKESKLENTECQEAAEKAQQSGVEERKANLSDNKNRQLGKRSYDEICRSYESMFAFDWDLKDINNKSHPPDREVTPIVVWFYINMLYFPYNAQDLAKVSFNDFSRPIFESLERVEDIFGENVQPRTAFADGVEDNQAQANHSNSDQSQDMALIGASSDEGDARQGADNQGTQQKPVSMSQVTQSIQMNAEDMLGPTVYQEGGNALPELIQKLQIEEHFFKFRDMFKEKMSLIQKKKAVQDERMVDESDEKDSEEVELEELYGQVNEEQDDVHFDQLVETFKDSLAELHEQNKLDLKRQYTAFTNAYRQAEEKANDIINGRSDQVARLDFPYKPTMIHEYGLDFLSFVDPHFVADIKENYEWYLSNQNEVLLNVNYPSKLEKEFLRHIEQWQQEKNDQNYKRILQQLAEGGDDPNGPNGLNIQSYNSLSAHKRGLVVQEDAQCAICNNGDYEDEDLIVFCGACNIPVHQRCYGIDKIPDNDWICNNCWAFNLRRGIMVKCILCPKRGGAMKPTNLFRTQEHFMRYYTAAQKKKGLQHQNYFSNLAHTKKQLMGDQIALCSSQVDLSGAMNDQQMMVNEKLHQQSLQVKKQASSGRSHRLQFFEREDKNHALSSILGREGNFQEALIMQIKEAEVADFPQNKVDLHFLKSEAIAEIPEDYTFFLQRNEQRLESPETVPTETLYEWVHLSCAMWIPGPSVTPKTPVRMSKIDTKRFDLQCIICGKRNSGACIQCQHSRCMISFHIECARRSNYFLEVERVDRQSNYRVFCEKHRPLKIVREMEDKDKQTLEEVQKFSKVIDRCLPKYANEVRKQNAKKRLQPFSKPPAPEPPSKRELLAEKKQQRLNLIQQKRQQKENERLAQKEQLRVKKEQERLEKERQKKQKQEAALALAQKKAQASQLAKQIQQAHSNNQNSNAQRIRDTSRNQQQQVHHTSQSTTQQLTRKKSTANVNKPEPVVTAPRWKDKDKKLLFERVKERFLQLFKLRVNVVRVDPMVKIKKRQDLLQKKNEKELRKKEKKQREKLEDRNKQMARYIARKILLGGQRSGLRSRSSVGFTDLPDQDQMDQGQSDMPSSAQQPFMDSNMDQENPELEEQRNKKEDTCMNGDDFFQANNDNNMISKPFEESESSNAPNRRPKIEELLAPEEVDPYFKFATPTFVQEIDWAVTFSKYDFPWHEIKFGKLSAKECYKMYTSQIRDAQTFFKKVLGGKDKHKKYIARQLDEQQRIFFGTLAQTENQAQQASSALPLESNQNIDGQAGSNESEIENFCKCKGKYQSQTGCFVMCESEDDCINGGWLHPECTTDLFKMSQEQIDKLDKWYCEDCVRVRNLNNNDNQAGVVQESQQPMPAPDMADQNEKKVADQNEKSSDHHSNSSNALVQQQSDAGSRDLQMLASANQPSLASDTPQNQFVAKQSKSSKSSRKSREVLGASTVIVPTFNNTPAPVMSLAQQQPLQQQLAQQAATLLVQQSQQQQEESQQKHLPPQMTIGLPKIVTAVKQAQAKPPGSILSGNSQIAQMLAASSPKLSQDGGTASCSVPPQQTSLFDLLNRTAQEPTTGSFIQQRQQAYTSPSTAVNNASLSQAAIHQQIVKSLLCEPSSSSAAATQSLANVLSATTMQQQQPLLKFNPQIVVPQPQPLAAAHTSAGSAPQLSTMARGSQQAHEISAAFPFAQPRPSQPAPSAMPATTVLAPPAPLFPTNSTFVDQMNSSHEQQHPAIQTSSRVTLSFGIGRFEAPVATAQRAPTNGAASACSGNAAQTTNVPMPSDNNLAGLSAAANAGGSSSALNTANMPITNLITGNQSHLTHRQPPQGHIE